MAPVSSAPSEGVHELIHAGRASLVTRGEHVEDLVGAVGEATWVPPRAHETLFDLLREDDRRMLDAVPLGSAAATAASTRGATARHAAHHDAVHSVTRGRRAEAESSR